MIVAFILNIIIVICELVVLSRLNKKKDILKYYTYLQNFLCLIVSIIFCIYCIGSEVIPEYVRGLRYIVSTGLIFTTFIYILLSTNKDNKISDKDFKGIKGSTANIVLHYLCPILSLISFIWFERSICLSNSIWTLLVAIPSCLYWIVYFILSVTKLWKEPYDFSTKNKVVDSLMVIMIPISFIIISIILWNVR